MLRHAGALSACACTQKRSGGTGHRLFIGTKQRCAAAAIAKLSPNPDGSLHYRPRVHACCVRVSQWSEMLAADAAALYCPGGDAPCGAFRALSALELHAFGRTGDVDQGPSLRVTVTRKGFETRAVFALCRDVDATEPVMWDDARPSDMVQEHQERPSGGAQI